MTTAETRAGALPELKRTDAGWVSMLACAHASRTFIGLFHHRNGERHM